MCRRADWYIGHLRFGGARCPHLQGLVAKDSDPEDEGSTLLRIGEYWYLLIHTASNPIKASILTNARVLKRDFYGVHRPSDCHFVVFSRAVSCRSFQQRTRPVKPALLSQ